jgi:hypothetical protein
VASPGSRISTSNDFGMSWTEQTSGSLHWIAVASSADGTRFVAATDNGYLFNPTSMTTPGTAGFIAGTQYEAAKLQYFGNGLTASAPARSRQHLPESGADPMCPARHATLLQPHQTRESPDPAA